MTTTEVKIPKTLAGCADKLYQMREERLVAQAKIDKLEEQEKVLKEHLILNLSKENAEGIVGKLAKVGITRKVVATVKDWDAVYKYISKTKRWELMQRRMNDKACKELWEDKKTIPGVEPFNVLGISLTKK